MRVARRKAGGLDLDLLSDFERQMLFAVERIVSEPPSWLGDPSGGSGGTEDEELHEDWSTLVRPELEELFAGQALTLARDVAAARAQDDFEDLPHGFDQLMAGGQMYWRIGIPPEHVEDWYGALNLARLTLEARENFGAIDETLSMLHEMDADRQFAALHFLFYSGLQEALLHCMMRASGNEE